MKSNASHPLLKVRPRSSHYSIRGSLALSAILQDLIRLLDRRHRFGRNDERRAVDNAVSGVLVRCLESLTDLQHAVDDDGVDAFVSLELFCC